MRCYTYARQCQMQKSPVACGAAALPRLLDWWAACLSAPAQRQHQRRPEGLQADHPRQGIPC